MTVEEGIAAVIVAHNSADHLPTLIGALLEQLEPPDEIIVVDNVSTDGSADVARSVSDRVSVIEPGFNGGFAAGCHVGVERSTAPLLLFLNPDSIPRAGCIQRLRAAASEHPDWGAWQAAVMISEDLINSDGGIVHYLGFGWAGHCGAPAAELPRGPRDVTFPSGAGFVIRRAIWNELGGLDASYFLYCEDLDLGLRLWSAGYRVGLVPEAQVLHQYEFDKGRRKWFWLERNRWRTILSVYPTSLLLLLSPALVASELALVLISARDGWLAMKLRAQASVIVGLPRVLRRRQHLQGSARISPAEFASHLTASLDSQHLPIGHLPWLVRGQAAYWAAVTWLLSVLP